MGRRTLKRGILMTRNILRGKAMNLADLHLVTFLTKNVGDKR
jgi:hypothetical protein